MNAKEIRRIEKIQKQYVTKETNNYDYLVALDKRIKRPAKIFSFILGILAALVLGTGMCACMNYVPGGMFYGVIVGCIGILMCSVNYPIYKLIKSGSARKHKKEILSLSEKLLKKEAPIILNEAKEIESEKEEA